MGDQGPNPTQIPPPTDAAITVSYMGAEVWRPPHSKGIFVTPEQVFFPNGSPQTCASYFTIASPRRVREKGDG